MQVFKCVKVKGCVPMDNLANLEPGQKQKNWFDVHFVDRGMKPISIGGGDFLKDSTGGLVMEGFQEMSKCKSPVAVVVPVDNLDMILVIECREWAMGGKSGMSLTLVSSRPATLLESKGLNSDPFLSVPANK